MKKRLVIFVMILFSILITACSSAPKVANEKMMQDIKGYKLPVLPNSSTAVVYVVRPKKVLGMIIPFKISVDDVSRKLNNGEVLAYIVKPGNHTLVAKSENTKKVEFKAKAKQVYFYETDPHIGWLFARISLESVDSHYGVYQVKKIHNEGGNITPVNVKKELAQRKKEEQIKKKEQSKKNSGQNKKK